MTLFYVFEGVLASKILSSDLLTLAFLFLNTIKFQKTSFYKIIIIFFTRSPRLSRCVSAIKESCSAIFARKHVRWISTKTGWKKEHVRKHKGSCVASKDARVSFANCTHLGERLLRHAFVTPFWNLTDYESETEKEKNTVSVCVRKYGRRRGKSIVLIPSQEKKKPNKSDVECKRV